MNIYLMSLLNAMKNLKVNYFLDFFFQVNLINKYIGKYLNISLGNSYVANLSNSSK